MKKPEFDIYQVADVSTKYITKEDGRLLVGEEVVTGDAGGVWMRQRADCGGSYSADGATGPGPLRREGIGAN